MAAIALAVAAIGVGAFYEWIGGALLGVFSAISLSMAIGGSGYHDRTTAYQGSACPKCNTRNRIWPWNF